MSNEITMNPALVELARRELARRFYADYLAYTYGDSWVKTKMSAYLAERIQSFIEMDTGHIGRHFHHRVPASARQIDDRLRKPALMVLGQTPGE